MYRFVRCWGLGALLWSAMPVMGAGTVEVTYDRDRDEIAIQAKDATLAQLFVQLEQKAGIASRIDASVAGDLVSVNQPMRPAAEVFQYLLNRYSYTLRYRSVAKNRLRLSAVSIVGATGSSSGRVSPPSVQQAHGTQASGAPRDASAAAPAPMPDLPRQNRSVAAPDTTSTTTAAAAANAATGSANASPPSHPPMRVGGTGLGGRTAD